MMPGYAARILVRMPLLKSEWVEVDRFIAGALGLSHPFV
jgi:hypothetical protein